MPTRPLIALLRGINVGGNKSVPMVELKKLATGLGYGNVATYIQSGNLVFTTDDAPREAEAALETALEKRFGFTVEVIVRTASEWKKYAAGSPFPDAEADHAKWLLLGVAKRPLAKGAGEALVRYTHASERVHPLKDALWIDFGNGVAKSKLSPAVLDRAVGSTVTARNFHTVLKLAEMAAEMA